MSKDWYLMQPKRHLSGFELEEIEQSYDVFDEILQESPEAYEIEVNGEIKTVIIQSTTNYNKRRILFKNNDLHWGDLIIFEGEKWLVADRPFFNRIYSKSHIKFCNTSMIFEKWEREIIDRDPLNNPIYGDSKLTTVEIPCVVESITNWKTPTGEQINFPEGDMVIEISNTNNELIQINNKFKMFGDTYRIAGIDKSKIYQDKGVLILVVSRVAN